MSKAQIALAVVCLMVSRTALGQHVEQAVAKTSGRGVNGKMFVGGYVGYTLGLGNAFWSEEQTFGGIIYKSSFKPVINLGGTFHYGISEKLMVGGELSFQSYVAKESLAGQSQSESFNKNSIMFSGLYTLSYVENKRALFLTCGAGLRQFADYRFGFFAGLVYQKMVSKKVGFCGIPKLHYILTKAEDPLMLSFSIGVLISIGK